MKSTMVVLVDDHRACNYPLESLNGRHNQFGTQLSDPSYSRHSISMLKPAVVHGPFRLIHVNSA